MATMVLLAAVVMATAAPLALMPDARLPAAAAMEAQHAHGGRPKSVLWQLAQALCGKNDEDER